jgi:hypothetical protein
MPVLVDHSLERGLRISGERVFVGQEPPVQCFGILVSELAMAAAGVSVGFGVDM